MKITRAFITITFVSAFIYSAFSSGIGKNIPDPYEDIFVPTMVTDTIPVTDNYGDHVTDPNTNPFDISPSVIEKKVEYDPASGNYVVYEKIGDEYYRTPTYLTFEEYLEYKKKQQQKDYFNRLAGISTKKNGINAAVDPMERIDVQNSIVDRLFGGTEVNIQPQGQVDVTLQSNYYNSFQPTAANVSSVQFNPIDPEVDIRVSTEGNIGTKLNLDFNYDTQSTFDFDRQIKLAYDTEAFGEDDIIKKIEAGNVSLPLRGNLIQGAQSLFGFKTELQFGHLRLTAIASQQQSEQNNLRIESGSAVQEFELTPDQYDENRHFFLSHYNRETFEKNLKRLPQIVTSFRIAQLEVWISDNRPTYQNRTAPIVALADIGEPLIANYTGENPIYRAEFPTNPNAPADLDGIKLPDNSSNQIFDKLVANPEFPDVDDLNRITDYLSRDKNMANYTDFSTFQGRMLSPNEYSYNDQLGILSLNIRLQPDQNLAVAYTYTYAANCDETYSVGSISAEGSQFSPSTRDALTGEIDSSSVEPPKVLFTKMLKSPVQRTTVPTWDLMMKNVYPLRSSQVNPEEFRFDIFFEDDSDGSLKKFIPEPGYKNLPLLQVFNLDNLNKYNDPQPDGLFDFVPGVTVIPSSGSVMFPVLEPFGSSLDSLLVGLDQAIIDSFKYQLLYDTSVTIARQSLERNKFLMKGEVSSATSGEINLGPFVPEGSVRVTAGGVVLQEGADYEVDYSLGRLRIINESYLQQGTPLNVSYEDQALFSLQQKTMLGLRADYDLSDNFSIGATYLKLSERPFTRKVNVGNDPINNRIFGLDLAYSADAPFVTKMVDKLPLYSTKEKSSINFSAEAAYLKPGHSGAINVQGDDGDDGGVVSIDDFEGAISGLLLGGFNSNQWSLASTPDDNGRFREATLLNDVNNGVNRAKINWYAIDRQARRQEDFDHPYTRLIDQKELFNRDVQVGQSELITFDIGYYPSERGPYNFDLPEGTEYSQGITPSVDDGSIVLNDPESRWGGIMRSFQNTDFEAANYEFIEFWMLNPYMDRPDGAIHTPMEDGKIIIHLGNVSEDIIRDGTQFFENTLPAGPDDIASLLPNAWGQVSQVLPVNSAFDRDNGDTQDVGLDGINDSREQIQHIDYLSKLLNFSSDIQNDPAGDNFSFIQPADDPTIDLLTRYKNLNSPDMNANLDDMTNGFQRGNRYPESEDLNGNRSLDVGESFYKYEINISNLNGELDQDAAQKYITETKVVTGGGVRPDEIWYRFRIPINNPDQTVGSIEGFRAIQFMRMYMTDFSSPKTFRLADFQLVRNLWRKSDNQCFNEVSPGTIDFTVDEVGIEENGQKLPFGYQTPSGVEQEELFGGFANLRQDEKSLALNFCNLADDCEVGINKLALLDMTQYDRLQLFMHAEEEPGTEIEDGDLYGYIRFGKDLVNHYYEYEIPLKISRVENPGTEQEKIWPDTNMIDVKFENFKLAKINRIQNDIDLNSQDPFPDPDRLDANIRVVGTPSLGYIKVFEIGVRNRTDKMNGPICGQVWVNELRAAGLNEKGGAAAQARLQVQMADLGEINLAANYSTIGWGSLDQRLLERSREEILQYDAAANLQLGKFLPSDWGVNIPFYAQYSKDNAYQQFDPFERDLTVDEKTDALNKSVENNVRSQQEADAEIQKVKDRSKETTTIKTYNFTNVKKEGKGGKPWSPSNFSASYAYTETVKTDAIIEEDNTKEYTTTLNYNYANKEKPIQPFKKLDNKYLRIVREFNFNLLPKSFTFSTNVNRVVNFRQFRLPDEEGDPTFRFDDRRFLWDRNYGLNWDFTKSLKFSYKSNASSIVDELRQTGIAVDINDRPYIDENGSFTGADGLAYSASDVDEYRNNNLRSLGRSKTYSHNVGLQYTLPIRYLPYLDWINVKTDYKADYAWTAGSLQLLDDATIEAAKRGWEGGTPFGNVIQNNQTRSVNGTFNFDKLYPQSNYLKKIEKGNVKGRARRSNRTSSRSKNAGKNSGKTSGQKDTGEEEEKKERDVTMLERILFRPLLSLRSIKATYKETFGTMLPGFMPNSELLGLESGFGAPGLGFAAGLQPNLNQWATDEQKAQWFNPSQRFSQQATQFESQDIDLKINLEPFKDFDIDIDFNKNFRQDNTQVFVNKNGDYENPDFSKPQALYNVGSYEISNLGFGTLFDDPSDLYDRFKAERVTVSNSLANRDFEEFGYTFSQDPHSEEWSEYKRGYGPNNYDVAVPAFLTTYVGGPIEEYEDYSTSAGTFSVLPSPNWTVKYDGLSKMDMFKNILTSFSINHSYKGSLQVNRFNTTLEYDGTNQLQNLSPVNDNYYSRIQIPAIVISDQFSPLIGVSMKTKTEFTFEAEWRKSRTMGLSLEDLREQRSSEIRFGAGYTIKNFRSGKKKKRKRRAQKDAKDDDKNTGGVASGRPGVKNTRGKTLTMNLDFSITDTKELIYEVSQGVDGVANSGQRSIQISPSADYDINENLTMRFFFDYNYSETAVRINSGERLSIRGGVTAQLKIN